MPCTGQSLEHDAARQHVTGTAAYIDDLPKVAGELSVDFVGAPVALGKVLGIDVAAARNAPGVVGVYTHRDLVGDNVWGPIIQDEPFLVEKQISYWGQPTVVIAAESRAAARRARQLVTIDVAPGKPILTIDDALAANSFIGVERKIERGDVETAFSSAAKVIEGVFECNGQEQLYFESQSALAIPGDGDLLKVLSSTQSLSEVQAEVAAALGIGMHQVVCECARMGGAFGGKETQTVIPAVMAALVAKQTGRPARIVYDTDRDMEVTGKRHAYKVWYRAAHDQGKIQAVEFRFFSNGGAFADLSTAVLERTMMHADNAYYLPNVRITGRICRTNLPPNTAFRGFGGPQGVATIENLLQDISHELGKDAWDVRRMNMYRDGDDSCNRTPYGQVVRDHVLIETIDQLEESSQYRARVAAAEEFTNNSATHARGIAMSPIKFGISFTTTFLNQGNALVQVNLDGTVQVSTGGTEMGQGLNTKIRQLVADEFDIEPDRVKLMATSTDKNGNASPTAASASTDINGAAAIRACRKIRARLTELAADHFATESGIETSSEAIEFQAGQVSARSRPNQPIAFAELCRLARLHRVDLGERGFYATPGIHFDRNTGRGEPFYYYTTGAAVSEVTIDRLSGEMTVDRVDLLMDLGEMINPGIDYGQMIGGFIQGMGWVTTEQLRYNEAGQLLANSPTTYKIPNVTDLPQVFNIDTIANPKHKLNVRKSKAVGEPPLMLAISVWLAAKHAIQQLGGDQPAQLALPATCEANLACISQQRQ